MKNVITAMALVAVVWPCAEGGLGPYQDNPTIVAQISALDHGQSLLLPAVHVEAGALAMHGMEKTGPGQRDYCNKMAYAPERRTSLYAGGNHASPHRMNDVWEYHLGSNTWHLIYGPDGGNAGKHKGAYFLTSRTLVRKPDTELDERQKEQIANYGIWWKDNVILREGHLTTVHGGPIMPAHTWDAFCYDEVNGRLLWGMGASPAAQLSTHAYFTKKPVAELQKRVDPNYTPMWMFDPAKRRWIHYRTSKPRAALRGMGATMVYLPDRKRSIWYVAAQNVSPHAFEMWSFDVVKDEWSELRPNGGKSISELALKEKVSPLSEQQSAYSSKHGKVFSVLGHDLFSYDVTANAWSKIATDKRIFGHDAHSVLGYDDELETLLLAFAPDGRGKALKLGAFSLRTNRWSIVEPRGDGMIPPPKYGGYTGYFDPRFDVFVIQARYSNRVWIYRH